MRERARQGRERVRHRQGYTITEAKKQTEEQDSVQELTSADEVNKKSTKYSSHLQHLLNIPEKKRRQCKAKWSNCTPLSWIIYHITYTLPFFQTVKALSP